MTERFEGKTDEELVSLGTEEAKTVLYTRVMPVLRTCILPFRESVDGYDEDDLMQEAALVFLRSVSDYDESKGAKFRTFLYTCVRSHMLNLLKRSKSKKTVSLYEPVNEQNPDIMVIDTITTSESFEDDAVREQLKDVLSELAAKALSPFELKVFTLFFTENRNASEIASICGCNIKSVENTLYRIRIKLRKRLSV